VSTPSRPVLRIVRDEPDQEARLSRFFEQHPDVTFTKGYGWWQACLPEPNGETIITRWTMRELLDVLDKLLSSRE